MLQKLNKKSPQWPPEAIRMYKIRSALGLCPGPRWGAHNAPPPDRLVGWGGEYPVPILLFSTPLASRYRRLLRLV